MLKKIKKTILNIDQFLFKKFGSDKSLKFLQNVKEAKTIFSYLNDFGEESKAKFVGGCVRKSLSGEKIDDIDLATSLTPDKVKNKLNQKKVKVIDTGLSHGTLTAILNKKKFEITTLRKDILTDGRHAQVEFTSKWEEDALRRDFTVNAIYADIDGRIHDPLNGIEDLEKGIIKFIGNAEERIQEDYLRILRYFRFFTQYSKTDHDENVIRIIKKNINGLNKISNERIYDELKKILRLKNLNKLFSDKLLSEIIISIFPQFKYFKRIININNLEEDLKNNYYDDFLILSLLIIDESKDYEYFCHKYRLSNKEKNRFANISNNFQNLKSKKFYTEENIRRLVYLSNKQYVVDLLLFSIVLNKKTELSKIKELLNYSINCKVPKFPISGDYLKEHGYKSGVELGKKLKLLEEKWIQNNFVIDNKVIEKSLGKNKYG